MGDEDPVPDDVGPVGQLVVDVGDDALLQLPKVLFAHGHVAVLVVEHPDAGLDAHEVGPHVGQGRAAAAGVEKGQGVQDEAC